MKKFIAPLIFVIISLICFISFNVIGAEVASDGELIEPFFLIPIGAFAMMIGIIWAVVALIITIKSIRAKKE